MKDYKPINELIIQCHNAARKWWIDIHNGEPLHRNKGELIALIHSELSESLEGIRKNLPDDKLPQYPMEVVEMVDALIRIFDYLGGFHPCVDVQKIFDAKMDYNATRLDHTHAERIKKNGKKI